MTKTTPQPTQIPALSYDVIVLGSGAAGLAAAVTASSRGLKVLLVEKAAAFGGTSAISGGAVWLHDTDQARAAGHHLPAEQMRNYLKQVIGKGYKPELVEAFIEQGREALRYLQTHSELKYSLRPLSPDYTLTCPAVRRLAVHWKSTSTTGAGWASISKTCNAHPTACCCSAA